MSDSIPKERNTNRTRPCLFEHWRKSSFSGSNGDCIEVAVLAAGEYVGIRDSKATGGPKLRFRPSTWTAFVEDVRHVQPSQRELVSQNWV